MKNIFRCLGIIMVILVIGFTMGACSNSSNGGGGGGNSIEGTWRGTIGSYNTTFTANSSGSWTMSIPGVYSDRGTYSDDSPSRLTCQGYYIGTARVSDNRLRFDLNNNADPVPAGIYYFTRIGS